ncbi:MAG TPA: sigma-70 family RNA polymerase sigma factor [Streptosporangiaceae bacterium]|nr:sigma-70 family RNA polymerase sigma factor [Streptosporangiaceae bacterium]
MDDNDWLASRFQASRPRLRAVAYRILGSANEAEDALQEAWIHAAGGQAGEVANLDGWFTTIVARVCLDMLRSRKARREQPLGADNVGWDDALLAALEAGPEQEAVLADSVGLALLVVLDTLGPAERVAFVLHDMFGLPFEDIAAATGRSPSAARQLASRARRRVQGAPAIPEAQLARRREVAAAFLAASRGGDMAGLLALLDPNVVLHADATAAPGGAPVTLRGATAVIGGARAASARAVHSSLALVNGTPGIVFAPLGKLELVLSLTIEVDKITRIDIIGDPARLDELDLALLS